LSTSVFPKGFPAEQVARVADGLGRPPAQEGYVAERHGLRPELIIVWAPCSCYWVGGVEGSFVTTCLKADCTFSWPQVEEALKALRLAELAMAQKANPGLRIAGTPEQARDVAPGEVSVEGAEAAQIISEGGPVGIPPDGALPETP
jgi:hypothetical protein